MEGTKKGERLRVVLLVIELSLLKPSIGSGRNLRY